MPEISEEELEKFKADSEARGALEASKKRLEDESKKYKTRAQEAESKLSEAEKAKLSAEGRTQELLDKERADRLDLEEKYKTRGRTALREKLRTEALKVASDVHDVDMLLKVADHKDLLKLDEENLTVEGVKDYVEKCRETHSYLFSKKRLDNGDNRPPAGNQEEFKSEDDKYLSELRACSTRQQMSDVRKKYGKAID